MNFQKKVCREKILNFDFFPISFLWNSVIVFSSALQKRFIKPPVRDFLF